MTITQHADVPFFDTMDPAFRIDAPEVLAAAKASWYARTPTGPAVLGYDECVAMLRDRRFRPADMDFVIAMGVTSGPFIEWLSRFILALEGEDHIRLRRLMSKAFTLRSVDRLRPFMRAKAHELIDAFADEGECEFMAAFSDLYSAWVIGELIGIAASEFDQFFGWSADLGLGFGSTCAQELDRVEAALAGLYACCDELIAARRRQPCEDLISALIAVEEAGDQLSTEELRTMVVGLVFAGQDTTRNQLALAMATFAEHPDQWALLAARPELVVTAVEEVIRVNPTGAVITRTAVEDVEFNGLAIPAGTLVILFGAAANRQRDIFGDAVFDITAERPAHLSFGGGMHYCLGARLARVEMCEALPILAARLGTLELAGPVTWRPHIGVYGPVTLPLRFGARA